MNSRERVMKALNFEATDRLPKDLGGMASTGINAFAYPKLVEALGLPARRTKVYDTYQMLALPDMDVLDALGCDVVTILGDVTNAFEEPEKWHEYDFNGRLAACVRDAGNFKTLADGTIVHGNTKMPTSSYVFDMEHGGNPVDFSAQLPKEKIGDIKKEFQQNIRTDEEVRRTVEFCKRVREQTDKAVFFTGPIMLNISLDRHGGLGVFPLLCMLEPEYVAQVHGLVTEFDLKNTRMLLPEIAGYIDIVMLNADDWGTQGSLMASPDVYRNLFQPYLRKMNDECHRIAPEVKTFLHSCGAIYDMLDLVIESGFDILNPVQWNAGGRGYKAWKDKCRNRIALWGGGVNAQETLPFGSVEDVASECAEVVSYLKGDNGYVFNSMHNILAEIEPGKIIAMYETAGAL